MRLFQRVLLTALAMALPSAVFAQAGTIGSYSRPQTNPNPTVSPYLNLNRGGNPAINYYGVVRPQFEANRNFQMIEQGTFGPQAGMPNSAMVGPDGRPLSQPGVNNLDPTALLQTGHPSTFFYYSHYFPMAPGGAGGGRAGGPGSAPGSLNTAASANFGRPANNQMPIFVGGNGIALPINPGGSSIPTTPGQLSPSLLP